jgi:hypothetical protein
MHIVLAAKDEVPGRKQAPPQVSEGQGRCAEDEMFLQVPEVESYVATYALDVD